MRSKFLFSLFSFFLAGVSYLLGQSPQQLIVVNSNIYMAGNLVTVATYDLNSSSYSVFDSIPARFASDVVIEGAFAYVAADSLIVRYDIDTHLPTAQAFLPGVRKLAVSGNTLVATTGYGGDSLHVHGFDATTLQPSFSVDGISGDCEGIVVRNDTAYVAVPGAWGSPDGRVAVIDVNQGTLSTEINLDSMGRGIDRMYLSGGKLWTVNSIAYANPWGVVSEIDLSSFAVTHHRIELNTLHSPGIYQNALYLRRGTEGVFQFDPSTGSVADSMVFSGNFITGVIDTVRMQFLMTESDYFSYGILYRLDWNGAPIDTVDVGISPEALAIDYRSATSVAEEKSKDIVQMWPVPVQNELEIRWGKVIPKGNVQILDLNGRMLMSQQLTNQSDASLDVSTLPDGVYLVRVEGLSQPLNGRFIK